MLAAHGKWKKMELSRGEDRNVENNWKQDLLSPSLIKYSSVKYLMMMIIAKKVDTMLNVKDEVVSYTSRMCRTTDKSKKIIDKT